MERKEYFDIHASVVFQLGESLITSPFQALLELIKNSYDADASYCKVTIITSGSPPDKTKFPDAHGWIIVEDDGSGMDLEDIKRGWLTISNSRKRLFKKQKRLTQRGRTPLGDKGLGRLGTQRLGANLEMVTRKEGGDQYSLAIPWSDFRAEDKLSNIAVPVISEMGPPGHGTKLIISDLQDLDSWRGSAAIKNLERQLSQLVSPYEEVREFTILVTVDGQRLELQEVSVRLRDAAQLHYELAFDGALRVQGKAKLSYFRPGKEPDRSLFQQLVEADNGDKFFNFLTSRKGAERFALKRERAPWFVSYRQTRPFEEFPELQFIEGKPADPGPFHGIVDYFTMGAEDVRQQSIFSTPKEFRDLIQTFSGIRVFRDGFGIRVDRDWLKLGAQQTRGSSWYGLRPENTLGFISLTARSNSQLEETTDREGFKHNGYYDNFYEVLSFFVKFTEDVQEFLRRGWNEFRRETLTLEAAAAYNVPPEELGGTLSKAFVKAGEYRALLQVAGGRLSATANKVSSAMSNFLAHPGAESSAQNLRSEIGALRTDIDSAVSTVAKTEVFLEELVRLEKVNKAIQEQLEALREQIRQVHEIVGLGLTAEALTHEMNNVATDLAARAQDLSKHIRTRGISDRKLIAFVDHVKTTVNALQKQLQFLAPSLQFVREKRELIVIKDFLSEIFKHYIQRFSGEPVSLLLGAIDPNFKVSMNRGKLIQVLDNLFLNSEYWLLQDVKAHRIVAGQIKVDARRPIITVSDTGTGIDPLLESSIFEPFVTGKGKGKGRGLGLYIVRQLLEAENCHIDLSPERNRNGRLFKFEIDLAGVASD